MRWFLGLKKAENIALQKIGELDRLILELFTYLQSNPNEAGMLSELLLQKYYEKEITYTDVRDTFMNFIFAGFETTAAALTFSLHCFAKHSAMQQNISHKLVVIKNNQPNNWQNIEVPELTNFTKEAMRFYPPVWFYIRESVKDDIIDDYFIPKGSFIFICPFALHQNANNWENPEIFNQIDL